MLRSLSKEAAKKTLQRSKVSDPKRLLSALPTLVKQTVGIATFKAGNKRKTVHQHLFLPKDYSADPIAISPTPWTAAEVLDHLEAGWGEGNISDLELAYLYGPEPEVSG